MENKYSYDEIRNKMIHEIEYLPSNHRFVVRELIEPMTWNKFDDKDRRYIGKQFNKDVKSGTIANVKFVGKSKDASLGNIAIYTKK